MANTTTGPDPADSASWIGFVVVRTPSESRTGSFSSEYTATVGAR
ncbi:hypothetical protein ACFWGM_34050 [Streptomyces roseolus]